MNTNTKIQKTIYAMANAIMEYKIPRNIGFETTPTFNITVDIMIRNNDK